MAFSRTGKKSFAAQALDTSVVGLTFVAIGLELYGLFDLQDFELPYLRELFGMKGVALTLLINAGFIFATWRIFRNSPMIGVRRTLANLFVGLWAVALLWFLDWLLIHKPLTLRVQAFFARQINTTDYRIDTKPEDFDGFVGEHVIADPRTLAIMQDRIVLNDPVNYRGQSPVVTIIKHSKAQNVDPTVVFFLAYVGSFYGNATSGPMPLFDRLTPESIRRLVQFHLPTWVVESRLRYALTHSDLFTRLLGEKAGVYIRYIVQKYTLDAPIPPYALNSFSDALLVFQEYPDAFPELRQGAIGDSVTMALRDSFLAIDSTALKRPYEYPYSIPTLPPEYFDAHREDLKKFARAVFYKINLDFDFATRVEVLHAKYTESVMRRTLGDAASERLPYDQRLAMLVMPRDLYTPNIGKTAYNIYALPELNCTAVEFVAQEAKKDFESMLESKFIWRPADYEKLWAGAGFRLRVFNEVWLAATGTALAGLNPTDTAQDAIELLQIRR